MYEFFSILALVTIPLVDMILIITIGGKSDMKGLHQQWKDHRKSGEPWGLLDRGSKSYQNKQNKRV